MISDRPLSDLDYEEFEKADLDDISFNDDTVTYTDDLPLMRLKTKVYNNKISRTESISTLTDILEKKSRKEKRGLVRRNINNNNNNKLINTKGCMMQCIETEFSPKTTQFNDHHESKTVFEYPPLPRKNDQKTTYQNQFPLKNIKNIGLRQSICKSLPDISDIGRNNDHLPFIKDSHSQIESERDAGGLRIRVKIRKIQDFLRIKLHI